MVCQISTGTTRSPSLQRYCNCNILSKWENQNVVQITYQTNDADRAAYATKGRSKFDGGYAYSVLLASDAPTRKTALFDLTQECLG